MDEDNRCREALVALFAVGVVAFSPLVLDVFDGAPRVHAQEIYAPAVLLGVPLLYLYMFTAWGILIALMALVVHRAGNAEGEYGPTTDRREDNE